MGLSPQRRSFCERKGGEIRDLDVEGKANQPRLPAVREFERRDLRRPVDGPTRPVELLRVPESAIVDGVDGHAAVITPAAEGIVELDSTARRQYQWPEHGARRRPRRLPD